VTHRAVVDAARQYTLGRIAGCSGPVLAVHDATELDYTSLKSLCDDLGQIGKGLSRGYVCQNVVAVEAETGEVLGLLDQLLHHRDEVPDDETLSAHRERESRESLLWIHGSRHLPNDPKVIDIADQGSDTFEFLEHEFHGGRRFVIRACKVRKVYAGHEAVGPQWYLKDYVRSLPELGRFTMDVQAQGGRHPRKARKDAEFVVRGGPLLVCPPHARHGLHGNDPLPPDYVTVLSVWRYGKARNDLTIHDFFYALARLGGHQNRKRDHRPGWLVLWRGWTKLQAMLDGYEAANLLKCGKT